MLLEHIAAQGLHIHRMHRICITQKHYQLAMLPHIHYNLQMHNIHNHRTLMMLPHVHNK